MTTPPASSQPAAAPSSATAATATLPTPTRPAAAPSSPATTATATSAGATVPPLHPSVDGYPETQVTIAGDAGEVTIPVKVADSDERRAHGLMEVADLPDGTGMLFVYAAPTTGAYYMLNTLVPLDIAFVDAEGRVIATFAMEPCSAEPCPTYGPDGPFQAALEVPQGWLDEIGVAVGDRVTWGPIQPAAP